MIPCEGISSLGLDKRCLLCDLAMPRGDKLPEAGLQLLGARKAARKNSGRREESLEKKEGGCCLDTEAQNLGRMFRRTKSVRKKQDQPGPWTLP